MIYKEIYIFKPTDKKLMEKIFVIAAEKKTIIESINLNTFVFTNSVCKFVLSTGEKIGFNENNDMFKIPYSDIIPEKQIKNAGNPVKIVG